MSERALRKAKAKRPFCPAKCRYDIDGEERWSEQWNWYVYDGMYRFLDQGMTYDSASSLLAAKQWINDFMDYDDEEPDTALADAKNWVNLN